MKIFLPRRPSAAMLVASTALVSSLAGPAVADEVAHIAQTITSSKQIKNGTVTGADIKNGSVSTTDLLDGAVQSADIGTGQVDTSEIAANAIRGDKIQPNSIDDSDMQDDALTGADVFNNSLTGADVNEESLGQVPNARTADRAVTAGTADNADTLDGKDAGDFEPRAVRFGLVRLSFGEERELGTVGPFTFRARCVRDEEFGFDEAIIEFKTSEDNSAFDADNSDQDFDTGETQIFASTGNNIGEQSFDAEGDGTAVAPSGAIVSQHEIFTAVNSLGADCAVGGQLTEG